MNCDECLCHAFSSNNNYAVINCIKNTRWCLFYTNLSTNYTFILNINASAYILSPILSITTSSAPPPPPTTTTTTTSTKTTTTTSVSTSTTSPTCSAASHGNLAHFNGVPTSWTQYSYNVTANTTLHTIMFGFTVDGSTQRVWFLDDVSIVDVADPNTQLLQNPSFDDSTTALTGWTQYCINTCPSGSINAGQIASGSSCTSNNCYVDHCYGGGAFDLLSQSFPTVIGHIYTISFWIIDYGTGPNGATNAYLDIY